MKRLFLLTALIVASVQLQASHRASELNLKLQQQAWFTLTLDNQIFENPVNHFHIGELRPGNHYLQVTRLDHGYYGPYTVPVNIFNGYIHIPAQSRVHAFIDWQGNLRINKITALAPIYSPAPFVLLQTPMPFPVQHGMSDHEFDRLKNTIDQLGFESSKIQVASLALWANNVTSYQVKELMRMMSFESSKLEIAKIAYHRTIDKHNYFIVNDSFSFESSIIDLNEYINYI